VPTSYLEVVDASGLAGKEVEATIRVFSETEDIAGAGFTLNFDETKVTITKAEIAAGIPSEFQAVGVNVDGANETGQLKVSIADFTLSKTIAAGEVTDLFVVTFMIPADADPSLEVALQLSDASLSNPDAETIMIYTLDGVLSVAGGVLKITDGSARPEETAELAVLSTTLVDVAGAGFQVLFDPAKLQITEAVVGADNSTWAAVGIDLDAANTDGILSVSLADFTLTEPVPAGEDKELFKVSFVVYAEADSGEVIPVKLDQVSLSDTDANSISVMVVDGAITVLPPEVGVKTDLNDDGKTDVKDLFVYVTSPETVTIEQLDSLIIRILEKPLPSSLLASAQDMTSTDGVNEGAALVGLDTNFEIIVARFTFSYDNAYKVADVQLNRSLPSSAMIIPFYVDGRLIVDVINLGHGLVPAELGQELFRILFEGASYQEAKLTLERVEVADLTGKIYGSEAAKLSPAVVLPKTYLLAQNSPNPFNPSTTISYELPETVGALRVVMDVYNIRGQKVVTLVDELKDAGRYTVNWDGRDAGGRLVPSGVYFYRMTAGDFSAVRKMVILK